MDEVARDLAGLVVLIAVAVSVFIVFACAYLLWSARSAERLHTAWRRAFRFAAVLSLIVILVVTLRPTLQETTLNLEPGRHLFESRNVHASWSNVLGNLLLLMPLGMALPECTRQLRRPAVLIPACTLIACGIEVTQYVGRLGRSADVNDVILGVAGALLGYIVNLTALRPLSRAVLRRREAAESAKTGP